MPFFEGDTPKEQTVKTPEISGKEPQNVVSEPKESIKKTVKVKPKVKKRILPSLSISINPNAQVKEAPKEEKDTQEIVSGEELQKPLEAELLKKAWEALRVITTADQVRLKQCIKTNFPVILSESEFSFTVSNNFQAEYLRENTNLILPFLKERLHNSKLQMTILVSEKTESTVVFTANDKFKLMLEKNTALEQLCKRLDLELD